MLSFGMKEAGNTADEESSGLWDCRERNREETLSDLDCGPFGVCGL